MTDFSYISSNCDVDNALKLFREMLRIRAVEEEIAAKYSEQKMRCPTHLSIGQEAVPAAVSQALRRSDYAISTHRGHAHYLGKGGCLNRMIAEIYGKETGCSKGRGGSMHLIDLNVNFMGTSAIVGNSIPIGVGFALTIDRQNRDDISCVFLGDGATEEGVFYEAVNFAAVQRLPVLFIVENNRYSVYSPPEVRRHPKFSLCDLAVSLGANSSQHDGNDALAVQQAINNAVNAIRAGSGPSVLEFSVYRWREHCGPNYDNDLGYRTEEEFLAWKALEPVQMLRNALSNVKEDLVQIEAEWAIQIKQEIDEAFAFAEQSSFPDSSASFEGEFCV